MIEIDIKQLKPDTLDNLIGEFVLREGTDYGAVELSFDAKKAQLKNRLTRGEAKLIWNEELEECSIVDKDEDIGEVAKD